MGYMGSYNVPKSRFYLFSGDYRLYSSRAKSPGGAGLVCGILGLRMDEEPSLQRLTIGVVQWAY